uniref:Gypsy retrotransposon integrase-like protein 1 n=1 Tax=Dicentrarchus labrax TaxID=13489 RepID=A0A8P4KNJ7_DICLA
MDFKIDEFAQNPTLEKLDRCTKAQLGLIATFFGISVLLNARKAEIKIRLSEQLVESGIVTQTKPERVHAPEVLEEEVGAEAATATQTFGGQVSAGAEAPVVTQAYSMDLVALLQAGVDTEDLKLALRMKEVELETKSKDVEIMHLRIRALEPDRQSPTTPTPVSVRLPTAASEQFDVSRHIALVPQFRESEVDSFFNAFERIAATLRWPRDVWSLLLQCKLVGKAQEVCASLSINESLDYENVKATVLRAYELVPEAYRQKFRTCEKSPNQTYVEFAREKTVLLDKWCTASKVTNFVQLRELFLLEEFITCLPEKIVIYLNEQKSDSVSKAAVLADEFVLTHRVVFPAGRREHTAIANTGNNHKILPKNPHRPNPTSSERECFYCHEAGHLIASCPALQRKENNQSETRPKSVGLFQSVPTPSPVSNEPEKEEVDERYRPFILQGSVSLTGKEEDQVPITILRDTGANQSLILQKVLPFSSASFCGSDALVLGVKMSTVRAPLHTVFLRSPLISGPMSFGLRTRLPVRGVAMILGNDLAGKKVFPTPEVIENPVADSCVSVPAAVNSSSVFPACAVTRAQKRKLGDVVDLSDSFMCSEDGTEQSDPRAEKCEKSVLDNLLPVEANLCFDVDRGQFIRAQQTDPTLATCLSAADSRTKTLSLYSINDGVLMRNWHPPSTDDLGWNSFQQVVVPQKFRPQVLNLAHDNIAGHLGIKKTYHRILRYFFWPGLKADVTKYCRSCHTCQVSGKPNQVIPPAPLQPIPVIGEPFEHIILDCVGPLPKTKSGHQYILTLMCAATRYPEAIPLRTLKAKAIVKAFVNFFSTFSLPKSIQTDQGSNFMSKVIAQVIASLSIKHQKSSAYHPQSQGALERFHQTLKSMMRKFCLETGKELDEGLPLLLLAARESVQESTGFSPAELVFGHTVRGPLRLLRERYLSATTSPGKNVLDYVSSFRDRLHSAGETARSALAASQKKMKKKFDKKSVQRNFQVGEKVLTLLQISGPALQAKFCGPYVVEKKLSETDYVVGTPDRRRKSRVCHINMLKPYFGRDVPSPSVRLSVAPSAVSTITPVPPSQYCPASDGLYFNPVELCSRFENSASLRELKSHLNHLDDSAQKDIRQLIGNNLPLFSDTPSRTTVLSHEIDVSNTLTALTQQNVHFFSRRSTTCWKTAWLSRAPVRGVLRVFSCRRLIRRHVSAQIFAK